MFLNRTDINGVEPEVGKIIAYFKPWKETYHIHAGYIEEITPHEIVVAGERHSHGVKTDRVRTGLYVVPQFEPTEYLEEIGVDAFGTPVCVGDTVLSANLFNIFDEQGYSQRKKSLSVSTVTGLHIGAWVNAKLTRVITVNQASNAYKYAIPEGNRLMRVEYSNEDLYDGPSWHNAAVRHPSNYKLDVTWVRAKLTNCIVFKKSNRITTYMLQNRLSV